jgi:hypothetical protein
VAVTGSAVRPDAAAVADEVGGCMVGVAEMAVGAPDDGPAVVSGSGVDAIVTTVGCGVGPAVAAAGCGDSSTVTAVGGGTAVGTAGGTSWEFGSAVLVGAAGPGIAVGAFASSSTTRTVAGRTSSS